MRRGGHPRACRRSLAGLVLIVSLGACAPAEPFGDAGRPADDSPARDGREAVEDAARRIAAAGASLAKQLGEVARSLQSAAGEQGGERDRSDAATEPAMLEEAS